MKNDFASTKFFTHTYSVYQIGNYFNSLKRNNSNAKTKPETVAKTMLVSMGCGHQSINLLNNVNHNKKTKFNIYKKNEYIPKTHGLRDCIMDTDYRQIEKINKTVILKAKENKVFRNNKVDGLTVMAWDGVELYETKKNIKGLPEREYSDEIRKYVKYECAMNIGTKANIIISANQLLEVEKIITKSGKERAKTIGETKAFEKMWKNTEKLIGQIIDVNVFDALYFNKYVAKLIDGKEKYYVIRLKDENRNIYKDAKGLFENRKADKEYELVEKITEKEIKYERCAKKKDIKKQSRKSLKGL